MRSLVLAAGVIVAVLTAAPAAQTRGVTTPVTAPLDQEKLLALAEAQQAIDNQDYAAAYAALERLTRARDFDDMSSTLRRGVWLMMAGAAEQTKEWDKARAAIVKATAFPDAGADEWRARVEISRRRGDTPDVISSLTVLARNIPDGVETFSDQQILYWMSQATNLPGGEDAAFQLVDALLEHWTPRDPFLDLSTMRRTQVEGLLRGGQTARAVTVARRINNPDTRIAMRADKRYDALASAAPDLLNPKTGAEKQLVEIDALRAKYPRLLSGAARRTTALLDLDRAEDALAFVDPIITKAQQDPKAYDDVDTKLGRTIDLKNQALQALDRDTEALDALSMATRLPEQGRPNVNQTLNLAGEQMQAGAFKAALATVASVRPDHASPFGQSVALRITACSSSQLGDQAAADVAIGKLRDLNVEGARQLELALLCRGDLDGAAALVIDRLKDPIQRNAALFGLQVTPAPNTLSPLEKTMRERSAALIARTDVRTAAAAVGYIHTYRAEDLWPAKPVGAR